MTNEDMAQVASEVLDRAMRRTGTNPTTLARRMNADGYSAAETTIRNWVRSGGQSMPAWALALCSEYAGISLREALLGAEAERMRPYVQSLVNGAVATLQQQIEEIRGQLEGPTPDTETEETIDRIARGRRARSHARQRSQ